jgi:hypothetical protein
MVGAPVVPGRRKGGTQPVYLRTRRWGGHGHPEDRGGEVTDIWDLIKVIVGAIVAGYGAWRGFSLGWKKAQRGEKKK